MRLLFCIAWVVFAQVSICQALLRPGWRLSRARQNRLQSAAAATNSSYGPFYFDQPIDHSDPNSKTFKQRYWANPDWYEPGGPVILYNAGELPADWRAGYVTNSSMAELARRLHGIVIVMEHRSYGESQLGLDYSVSNLRTLNTEQALEDMASIIRGVKLPFELPPETKWIVYGGSYSGNLAAWMRYRYSDIVFAAIPSSAPVEMRYNFYQYFETIRRYGPEHCVHAIQAVILYVDHILFGAFSEPKRRLKAVFGVEDLKHDDDFAELLTYPLGLWQEMDPANNPFADEFCTIFDNLHTVHEYVEAYGGYIAKLVAQACNESASINECLDTHDPQSPMYTDLKSDARPWMWQVCTEYAYWQTATPIWHPTMVSRKLTTEWYQRQCPLMFGEHNVPFRPEWRRINREYKGWYLRLSRTFWIDGEWDPWRTLSVQSDDAPDRTHWDDDVYYAVLPKSVHHWDFFVTDNISDDIKKIHERVYQTLSQWLADADSQKES